MAPSTLVRVDGSNPEPYVLSSRAVLGRLDTCDLAINDKSVSREHARLSRLRDGYVVEDLGSTNGTLVNGRRIDEAVILRPGDILTVGSVDFRFDQEAPAEPQSEAFDEFEAVSPLPDEPPAAVDSAESRIPHPHYEDAPGVSDDVDEPVAGDNLDSEAPSEDLPELPLDTSAIPSPAATRSNSEAETSIEQALAMADQLRSVVASLSQELGQNRSSQEEIESARSDTRNLRAAVRGALDSVPSSNVSGDDTQVLQDLLKSLHDNPRDITVLMDLAQHVESIQEVVQAASQQREVLQTIAGLVEE